MIPPPACHPLYIPGADTARVAQAVAVVDQAGEHIGHRLDAAVRVHRKAGEIVLWVIRSKVSKSRKGSR